MTAPSASSSLADWLAYWTQTHVTAIDLGLSRIRPVAEQLGVLQPNATVLTVAGTNGKGSTTTVLSEIYIAAGQSVGLYQSPHITVFNERVRLNGQPVDDQTLIDAFIQVDAARRVCQLPLSFFEATTLAAFVIFKKHNCAVWVLEVGLGGRLDAVNLIDPDVAVITNIGLDHTDWLGDSVEAIAFEKAGIMRAGIPVIYADPVAMPESIAVQASQFGCRLIRASEDYHWHIAVDALYYATPALTLRLPKPNLAAVNVCAALTAALHSGVVLTQSMLAQALQAARLAGRFEQVLWQRRRLILDVAHNPHGMQFLLAQLAEYQQQQSSIGAVHMVFSMLQDKDIAAVVQLAAPMVQCWHIAALDSSVPRAASQAQLGQAVAPYAQAVVEYRDLAAALQGACQVSDAQDVIVVCGSFHTLDAVWEVVKSHDAR
ncbi:MAG: bifunctional tetrahydrofolate synthase/dihydrofolate synthase [Pseudomonadota bacterium]|nr:bifunctional tetrahydrofolate synthase/dihydrofolate synthase [Pseudomonadota bacterium]